MRDIDLGYLRKYGYDRYACKRCGRYMWSTAPRDDCPDRPCSKYEFLYKTYKGVSPLSVVEVRKKFIDFLARRGHGVVDPYPVVAKWRDDLYLTIASIVVFQPHVTDGIAEPPHNPLVIVQPSIRLTDIDNVGLTFGRHLTSFEMGGMHAFNKPGKWVYWVEGVLENTLDFFTKEIGLDVSDLVFKESWWEGGGNAGPAPEVLVDGLEVATLVFMKYKTSDGKLVDNPVLVVDCGYGIERIAWLTQRAPTGFHAVYGDLVKKYHNILHVEEPPQDVLKRLVYETSDREDLGIRELVEEAKKLGFGDYATSVAKSIYVYATLDHVRTLALMLSDGVVPSNTGEGYLARLVLRRLIRNLLLVGLELSKVRDTLGELIDAQIAYWKGDYIYGKFERARGYILDVVDVEAGKYLNLLVESDAILKKAIKRSKGLGLEELITIYDSYGIPPEIVAEKARAAGIEVEVPRDFYSIVAGRHSSPAKIAKQREEVPGEIASWSQSFAPTRLLFHENPYLTVAEAKVLGVSDRYVVLDATIFYPRSGGQDFDEGVIEGGNGTWKVVGAYKVGNVVVHVLDARPSLSPGEKVTLKIDWRRRYRLMRHHTATHIVLAAARKVLGDHVWQAGAEKTVEKARLDITHYKPLTREELRAIEEEANKAVDARISLEFRVLPKFEAEARFGTKLYQGGPVYSSQVRVVEIPGLDAQACFGTHVSNTAEVGAIKILSAERIQDGVVRLEFAASTRLPEVMAELESRVEAVGALLGGGKDDIVAMAKKTLEELGEKKRALSSYRAFAKAVLVERAESSAVDVCGVRLAIVRMPIEDDALRKEVVQELSLKRGLLAAVIAPGVLELAIDPSAAQRAGVDLLRAAERLSAFGRGGGKRDHVTMKLLKPLEDSNVLVEALRDIVCRSS